MTATKKKEMTKYGENKRKKIWIIEGKALTLQPKLKNNWLNQVQYTNDKQHSNERKRSNTPARA